MRTSSRIVLSGAVAATAVAGLAWSGAIGDLPAELSGLVGGADAHSQAAFADATGRQAPNAPVGWDWRQLLH